MNVKITSSSLTTDRILVRSNIEIFVNFILEYKSFSVLENRCNPNAIIVISHISRCISTCV